jgi:predicted RNA-binding Zn ribbon-like protein
VFAAGANFRCTVSNSCSRVTSDVANYNVCIADFNCDASVDFFDYLDFVAAFAENGPAADFNADTVVDFFDYLDFVAVFASGC